MAIVHWEASVLEDLSTKWNDDAFAISLECSVEWDPSPLNSSTRL